MTETEERIARLEEQTARMERQIAVLMKRTAAAPQRGRNQDMLERYDSLDYPER